MDERSPIEELQQEHRAALGALDALTDEVAAVTTRALTWEDLAPRAGQRLHALHQLLLLHFRKEEEGLFPDVIEFATQEAPEAGIVAGFFAEQSDDEILAHTTLRMRFREMEELLPDIRETNGSGQRSPSDLHDALLFGRDLLRRHTAKEEMILFPLIARLLTHEQMVEVRRRIAELIPLA